MLMNTTIENNEYVIALQQGMGDGVELSIEDIRVPADCSDWKKLIPAFLATLRALPRIRRCDVVVSGSVINGLFFAFLQRYARPFFSRPVHIVIDVGSTRYSVAASAPVCAFLRHVYSSVRAVLCYAGSSCDFWKDKIKIISPCFFIHLPVKDSYFEVDERADEDYIVSAGRMGRDYAALIDAVRGIAVKVIIIGGREQHRLIEDRLRDNPQVTFYEEIPASEYQRILRKARFVVLPLTRTAYHPGQTVLVQAMALGKAVIATRAYGTQEYIDDGEDGILVEEGNSARLREKIILLLNDRPAAAALGKKARAKALREMSGRAFAGKLTTIIKDIYEKKGKSS